MFLALSAALLGIVPAAADTAILKVTPGNGLVAGQWVLASWSGVTPGTAVYLRQCTLNPITIRDCGYLGPHALRYGGIVPNSGDGSLAFPVAGVLNAGNSVDRFNCDNLHACSIALFVDPSATNLSKATFDPISFAVSSDSCPAPISTDVVVSGQGTFTISRAFRGWEGRLCRAPNLLHVTYHATSSLRGEAAFVDGKASFAMTSQPLSHTSITTLAGQHRRFAYAPMVGSALVFGFRMVDPSTSKPITSLELTPSQLAAIFTGQLQDLNSDPDIVSQNPGITFPSAVRAIGRSDPSAQTRLLTSWFLAVARHTYRLGGPAFSGGPTDTYPQSGTITLLSGARAVAGGVANAPDPSQLGTIGWMDSSVAALYDLPSATVQNHAGAFVDATPASMRAAILAMHANPDGVTRSPRFLTKDAKAYPLPVITYLVAQTSVTAKFDKTKADVLRRFIRFAASRAHSSQPHLPNGYVALPASMSSDALRAANQLPTKQFASPTPTPTGTTTPPSTGTSSFHPFTPSSGGVPPPTSFPSGTQSGFPVGSATSGLPTGVLPPNTLASEGTSYAWPIVLIIGIGLIILGTLLSAALRVASGRGAKRALAAATPTAEPAPPPTEPREGA